MNPLTLTQHQPQSTSGSRLL